MRGVITKKHILPILRAFGLKAALRVLISNKPVALSLLMA